MTIVASSTPPADPAPATGTGKQTPAAPATHPPTGSPPGWHRATPRGWVLPPYRSYGGARGAPPVWPVAASRSSPPWFGPAPHPSMTVGARGPGIGPIFMGDLSNPYPPELHDSWQESEYEPPYIYGGANWQGGARGAAAADREATASPPGMYGPPLCLHCGAPPAMVAPGARAWSSWSGQPLAGTVWPTYNAEAWHTWGDEDYS
ncbi:hypothetical protein H9P43_002015 [Blastocladiella emersonii ATCC 22665]|nr:hypothetical protein H9P43_002015 [Blastocladiella emersonii ATCC 22665]